MRNLVFEYKLCDHPCYMWYLALLSSANIDYIDSDLIQNGLKNLRLHSPRNRLNNDMKASQIYDIIRNLKSKHDVYDYLYDIQVTINNSIINILIANTKYQSYFLESALVFKKTDVLARKLKFAGLILDSYKGMNFSQKDIDLSQRFKRISSYSVYRILYYTGGTIDEYDFISLCQDFFLIAELYYKEFELGKKQIIESHFAITVATAKLLLESYVYLFPGTADMVEISLDGFTHGVMDTRLTEMEDACKNLFTEYEDLKNGLMNIFHIAGYYHPSVINEKSIWNGAYNESVKRNCKLSQFTRLTIPNILKFKDKPNKIVDDLAYNILPDDLREFLIHIKSTLSNSLYSSDEYSYGHMYYGIARNKVDSNREIMTHDINRYDMKSGKVSFNPISNYILDLLKLNLVMKLNSDEIRDTILYRGIATYGAISYIVSRLKPNNIEECKAIATDLHITLVAACAPYSFIFDTLLTHTIGLGGRRKCIPNFPFIKNDEVFKISQEDILSDDLQDKSTEKIVNMAMKSLDGIFKNVPDYRRLYQQIVDHIAKGLFLNEFNFEFIYYLYDKFSENRQDTIDKQNTFIMDIVKAIFKLFPDRRNSFYLIFKSPANLMSPTYELDDELRAVFFKYFEIYSFITSIYQMSVIFGFEHGINIKLAAPLYDINAMYENELHYNSTMVEDAKNTYQYITTIVENLIV